MLPVLSIFALFTGMAGGVLISSRLYDISPSVFLDSAHSLIQVWDLCTTPIKGSIFGALIAIIGCSWGLTTTGGAKGVGQSTTTAVVTALLAIFISDFFLSWIMFQGTGTAGLTSF
jgi:phospholipid/cholesterol/gamma-HCH transport system permease protein